MNVENRDPLQCCGPSLEYCVRVCAWRKLYENNREIRQIGREIRQNKQGCTISEKGIRFRHPDYDPDRAQKLISSSTSRHL